MTDASTFSTAFQDSMRSFQEQWGKFQPGNAAPVAWPLAAMQAFWFETPLAVSTHLQKFTAGQIQAQVNLLADLSREDGPTNLLAKEAAFLQQSAMAWNTEWLEIASLIQTKILSAAQKPADAPENYPFSRAA
ncbi:hypothetical protein [Azorhizobium doebereinerae]|uniref:hypothetical protein n=1 Tax=Azorhizobium doebereinerae TaxID=281091 RepID=UPI0003FF89E8|nr:hypothetical protein [Azorhizobium doebereinerae]